MSVIKFLRDITGLFNWSTDANPTSQQDYQNAVKNWQETEKNLVDSILWQPETEYAVGNVLKTPSLPSECALLCTVAGISGATEPVYTSVNVGDTVTDGTVEWLVSSYLPTTGGTMTGAIEGNPITLTADDGNGNTASLVLGASGSATWNGKDVERVNAYDKTNTQAYIRFESGLQICWGRMTNIGTTESTVNFAAAFNDTPRVAISQNVTANVLSARNLTTTGFGIIAGGGSSNGGAYVAMGFWK